MAKAADKQTALNMADLGIPKSGKAAKNAQGEAAAGIPVTGTIEVFPKQECDLVQADCSVRGIVADECADLIVTSPPYNFAKAYGGDTEADSMDYQDYLHWTRQWLANAWHFVPPSGRLCVNVAIDNTKNGRHLMLGDINAMALEAGWKYHTVILWAKTDFKNYFAFGSWQSASAPCPIQPYEAILVLYKEQWKKTHSGESDITKQQFMEWNHGVWQMREEHAKRVKHPAPFPLELPHQVHQIVFLCWR